MRAVILPVKNEEDTIRDILESLSDVEDIEVIIISDSTDDTPKIVVENIHHNPVLQGMKITIRKQRTNTGKGGAMKEGVEISRGNPIIFINGDIKTFEGEWIDKLSHPITEKGCDIVKANYEYEGDDYVTGLVAKPLLEEFFPEVICNRPLEGEMAVDRQVFDNISLGEGFKVESEFIIDAYVKGYDIREAFLGRKKHGERRGRDLIHLATEVQEGILDKALEYSRL